MYGQKAKVSLPAHPDEITCIPAEKRVFIFWQCSKGKNVPGYISLCLETFVKFNPDIHIMFLNYENIVPLIGNMVDMKRLERVSFAQQSDILIPCFLLKYGGTFLDADMIYTGAIDWINQYDAQTLVGFGRPKIDINWAILSAREPNNFILFHIHEMQRYKLSHLPVEALGKQLWSFFGNSISRNVVKFLGDSKQIAVVPNTTFILEGFFGFRKDDIPNWVAYMEFWFRGNYISANDMISCPLYNIIALHNSWTPQDVKDMSASDFIKQNCPLAQLFRTLLDCDEIDEKQLLKVPFTEKHTLS